MRLQDMKMKRKAWCFLEGEGRRVPFFSTSLSQHSVMPAWERQCQSHAGDWRPDAWLCRRTPRSQGRPMLTDRLSCAARSNRLSSSHYLHKLLQSILLCNSANPNAATRAPPPTCWAGAHECSRVRAGSCAGLGSCVPHAYKCRASQLSAFDHTACIE
ncbi:hypothetical protein GQ54DRAFT_58149 [Martensiomyces pterosporus]|nr:hypothetical protein GQ54DRAFT_58149 [Martensiomyces pterosporus]